MKTSYTKLIDAKLDKNIVVIRANLNLRLKNGEIDDDSKIKALIPTLNFLQKANCKTIIMAHLGENCCEYNDELSLIPIRFALGRHLNKPIKFVSVNSCQNSIKFMEFGDILLLENLCFSPEEFGSNKKEKEEFIKQVAQYAEYYIDESFGVDQTLATTTFLPKLLKPLLGINHADELETIAKVKKMKKDGFISILGGRANESKLSTIKKLAKKSEKILLGGELASLFLLAKGSKFDNKIEKSLAKEAKALIKEIKEAGSELILPVDIVNQKGKTLDISKLSEKDLICDIGEKTIKEFQNLIETSKVIVVNGTMGIYEDEKFIKGTYEVLETFTLLSTKEAFKIVGGEDTMEAIQMLKVKHKKFNHVTTGVAEFIKNI